MHLPLFHSSNRCHSLFAYQEIVRKPVAVMCNCYGSHVFRSLLCLCKGVPLNSEFHSAKSSTVLSRRLNLMSDKERKNGASIVYQGFPDLLEFLVSEMLKCSTKDIAALQVDQYSSLVLQACSKSLILIMIYRLAKLLVL